MVESTALEKRCPRKGTVGSNPTLSAKIRNQKKRTKRGRAEGATLMHSPRRILNPKAFSTLRVALSFANAIL